MNKPTLEVRDIWISGRIDGDKEIKIDVGDGRIDSGTEYINKEEAEKIIGHLQEVFDL